MPNLEQSIAAGKAARALIELAESEAADLADPQRFWDTLWTAISQRYPQPVANFRDASTLTPTP